jgi:magnesium transporter
MESVLSHLAWFDVADPASAELDELARRFKLHELQIEDCRHRPQRPKVEEHDHYLFTVLKHIHDKAELEFDDIDLFLGRDFLISVRNADAVVIESVRTRAAEERPDRLDRLFYMIVDQIVDGYQPVLDKLADEISEIEDVVLDKPDPETLARIFSLKRKLIEFRRVAGGMREVVNALIRREKGLLGDDLDPYFRDVYDHVVRTVDMIETYRDLLSGALDIYLSAVANRTNEVMKVLTIWGTVALPLVIITGFFGMNLKLPWTNDPHGTSYAVALMAISTIAILVYFKVKRWF